MGLLGILLALALLMWLAFRGWSVLLVAPAAALLAAAMSGEPLLAHWTQTYMGGASRFVAQWFPLFLLGGLFGKLMDDSGSITAIAGYLTERLGTHRAMLSVVLASAEDGRVHLVANFDRTLEERGLDASKVIRAASAHVGGGGGGRPTMARAGGKDPAKLPEALATAKAMIMEALS